MDAKDWLDQLGRPVVAQLADTEIYRADEDTITLALGRRGVMAHYAGDVVWLAPSFAAGGTVTSRLQDKVQHLDIEQYGIREATIDVAEYLRDTRLLQKYGRIAWSGRKDTIWPSAIYRERRVPLDRARPAQS